MAENDDRARVLAAVWDTIRSPNTDTVTRYPAAARAVASGADPQDLVLAMTAAAYEAVFGALFALTAEEDVEALARAGVLSMLHEDLLGADPTGQEGEDLFSEDRS